MGGYHIYIYIYIYICMYIYLFIYLCSHIYLCECVCCRPCVHEHVCRYAYVYVTVMRMRMCMCMYMCICGVCLCMRMHTHTHVCARTYTRVYAAPVDEYVHLRLYMYDLWTCMHTCGHKPAHVQKHDLSTQVQVCNDGHMWWQTHVRG